MIVISGALVLVALVLLVVGLTVGASGLSFVYGSIAVSLLAFVFLVIGILQRRGEQVPAPAAAPDGDRPQQPSAPAPLPGPAPVDVSKRPVAEEVDPPVEDDDVEDELLAGGLVLVVAGRPRYHVDGCRYLNGKDVEELDVFDAQDEGFTPCGVCKPDEALAAELEDGDVELVEEPAAAEPAPAPEPEPVPAARGSRVLDPEATQTLAVVDMGKAPVADAPSEDPAPAPVDEPVKTAAPKAAKAP
ncbi:MAG: hypothetical protein JWO60_3245, partial [Frankiales bacterium]|nr:hypothetical protein [Frankiales bacterium]